MRLNDKLDRYEANFANLGLNKIPILTEYIKSYPKLLSEGVVHRHHELCSCRGKDSSPWNVDQLKPIQISSVDIDEYKEVRKSFNKEEWIALLMQTMGLTRGVHQPLHVAALARLIPFVENNYNLMSWDRRGRASRTSSRTFSSRHPDSVGGVKGEAVRQQQQRRDRTGGLLGCGGFGRVCRKD